MLMQYFHKAFLPENNIKIVSQNLWLTCFYDNFCRPTEISFGRGAYARCFSHRRRLSPFGKKRAAATPWQLVQNRLILAKKGSNNWDLFGQLGENNLTQCIKLWTFYGFLVSKIRRNFEFKFWIWLKAKWNQIVRLLCD